MLQVLLPRFYLQDHCNSFYTNYGNLMATANAKIFANLSRSFRCILGKILQDNCNNLQSYGKIL